MTHYVERIEGGYEYQLRQAFMAACRQHDFDCTFIGGGPVDDPAPEISASNEVYEFVDARHFDGAILLAVGLCRFVGIDRFLERFSGLRRLAVCSLGLEASDTPSIVSDNSAAIAGAVTHLVTHHGRRNLAFLGAKWHDPDIDARCDGFLQSMREHGLQVPTHRMLECWLEPTFAETVVRELLERDNMVDGIIAANDGAALGAQNAVLRMGRRVPQDVAITGYDNLPMAAAAEPSITSVSQELGAIARAAVDNIAAQLRGECLPKVSKVPTRLVLRQSCGCGADRGLLLTGPECRDASRRAHEEWVRLEGMYYWVLELSAKLSAAPGSEELEGIITSELPSFLRDDCYLGLFAEPEHEHFIPILWGRGSKPNEPVSASAEFLSSLGDPGAPRSLLVLGLTCPTELLGVIGFQLNDQRSIDYPAVAHHVGVAWHVAKLREQIAEQRILAERQAAAERTKATTVLASGVAHDLNNALGPLITLSEVVYNSIVEHQATGRALDPDITDDLQTIRASALHATETVKDLMTLGRLGRIRREPLDLPVLTRKLVDLQNTMLTKKGLRPVTLTIEEKTPQLYVRGSDAHLERAVLNVLRNALEAAAPAGEVGVMVSAVRLEQRTKLRESIPPGDYALVSITDNGPGIDEGTCQRIFEPFFSTKRLGESSGSGLGLAIVHSIIKEHLGYVDVISQLGRGTQFNLYIPQIEVLAPAQVQPKYPQYGAGRILVVDDDPTQLRAAKRVLSKLGYDVTTTNSGSEACELLGGSARSGLEGPESRGQARPRTSAFDVLILDLALNGDEDGLQLFRRIRVKYPDQKGILSSGHAFVDHEEQIREADLVWLPKPYTIEALAAAIQSALNQASVAFGEPGGESVAAR